MKKTIAYTIGGVFMVMAVLGLNFSAFPAVAEANQSCGDRTITVVSDTSTLINNGGSAVVAYSGSPAWTTLTNAAWIWNSFFVQNPNIAETVTFTKTFTVEGNPQTASLSVAADDYFKVSVNGNLVASEFTDFNFNAAKQYSITPFLTSGVNTLSFEVTNAAYFFANQGTPTNNPAGLIYTLTVTSHACTGGSSSSQGGNSGVVSSGTVAGTSTTATNSSGPSKPAGSVAGAFSAPVASTTTTATSSPDSVELVLASTTEETAACTGVCGGLICIVIALLTLVILYIIWLLISRNEKKGESRLTLKSAAFFVITAVIAAIIFVLAGLSCVVLPLVVFGIILLMSLYFSIL